MSMVRHTNSSGTKPQIISGFLAELNIIIICGARNRKINNDHSKPHYSSDNENSQSSAAIYSIVSKHTCLECIVIPGCLNTFKSTIKAMFTPGYNSDYKSISHPY